MLTGFALLLLAELIGEALRQILGLPVPGPVIGLFVVAIVMIARSKLTEAPADATVRSPIEQASDALIANMGLLFVPAGVGVIAVAPLLHGAWVPLGVALVVSTVLTLIVTGAVMHMFTRRTDAVAARVAKADLGVSARD